MNKTTAQKLFQDLQNLPADEREHFFMLLAANVFLDDNLSHAEVFGHLTNALFTADEAAEYLEISMSTFWRYVHAEKLQPSTRLGRNQMFKASELKSFKQILKGKKISTYPTH